MKFKTTLGLLIAVCLLGVLVWVVEQQFKSSGERRELRDRVLQTTVEEIDYLTIEQGDLRIDCVKRDGTWFIVKPLEAKADEGKITRILSVLEAMPGTEIITAAQRMERELTLKDYGLLEPRARFLTGNKLHRFEVLVGHDAPLGDLLYVKLAASENVIATSRGIMDVIPEKVEVLRDRTILHGDVARTTRLEIQRSAGAFIQVTRTADGWVMEQPTITSVDNGRISDVLKALYSLQVQEFVWDAKVQIEPYGLAPDEAIMRATVWVNGDEVGKELFLGKPVSENSDKIFAKRRDIDSIYTVQKDIVDVLSLGVNDLRDKNLFSIRPEKVNYLCFQKSDHKLVLRKKEKEGWGIIEPVQWKADDQVVQKLVEKVTRLRAESFVDGSQTNLVKLGLEPPSHIVQVLESCPEPTGENGKRESDKEKKPEKEKSAKDKQNRLWIGTLPEGKETVFAKFEDKSLVFELSTAMISNLGPNPTDPLVYRDRTMLALPPASIKRISLLKDGKEQAIARNESGEWIPVVSATNQVNQEVVENILFTVSNMRALRIESHNQENLAAFGLDRSEVTLTFGLSGEKGIQKSLILGFRSKTDGIYAMVQGQDVVFVLEKALVDRLTRDLTKEVESTSVE